MLPDPSRYEERYRLTNLVFLAFPLAFLLFGIIISFWLFVLSGVRRSALHSYCLPGCVSRRQLRALRSLLSKGHWPDALLRQVKSLRP
jgi:hypothetical protein